MNPHPRRLLMLILPFALLAAGCAPNGTKSTTPAPSETGAPAASQPSQTSASSEPPSVLPEKTGIPACDDYLASYKGCHRAAGIYAPDTIDDHYRTMRDTLLRESKDPTKRSVLEARCKSLTNMLKDALHGKSCEPASSGDTSGKP
ncbi:MAG TPA: hypothetical protein VFG67_04575 [Oleiagrimonas sp.]|nr:hypothetical protein [Oleiagrimonas sp.]